MTPEEHVVQAAKYMEMAEKPLQRFNGDYAFVGEDAWLETHVNTYTRLAQIHLLLGSTKAALQMYNDATKKDDAVRREVDALRQFGKAYGVQRTVTGRMVGFGVPPFQSANQVADMKADLEHQVRKALDKEGSVRLPIPSGYHAYRNAMKQAAHAWGRSNVVDVYTGIEYGRPGEEPYFTASVGTASEGLSDNETEDDE